MDISCEKEFILAATVNRKSVQFLCQFGTGGKRQEIGADWVRTIRNKNVAYQYKG